MCRSITYRYRICTHSWRPHVILCGKPTADATGKCPVYKVRFERRVIGSGNGYCARCWEGMVERERVLEGNMRRRVEEMRRGRAVEEEGRSLLGVGVGGREMERAGRDLGRGGMEREDGMRWILERERQRKENSEDFRRKNEEKRSKETKERNDTKHGWARKKEDPEFYII